MEYAADSGRILFTRSTFDEARLRDPIRMKEEHAARTSRLGRFARLRSEAPEICRPRRRTVRTADDTYERAIRGLLQAASK
jgi:hypothetical protein